MSPTRRCEPTTIARPCRSTGARVESAITISNQAYLLRSKRFWKNLEGYYFDAGPPLGDLSHRQLRHHAGDQTQWGDIGTITLKTPLGGSLMQHFVVGFDVNFIELTCSRDFNGDIPEDFFNPFNFAPDRRRLFTDITPQYRARHA